MNFVQKSSNDESSDEEENDQVAVSGVQLGKRPREQSEDEDAEEEEGGGRVSMMRRPGVPELGEVLELGEKYSEYGECRSVPGFDEGKLRVFWRGWVQISKLGNGRWCKVQRGTLPKTGRYKVRVDGRHYQVHNLLLRAFEGPKPAREHTGDHINRNSTDNRVENLRWATKAEQSLNRNKPRLLSTAKPIYVQKLDKSEPPQWFESIEGAKDALGLNKGHLSRSANAYKDRGKIKEVTGFRAWWAPAPEPQWDLLPGEDSNLLLPPVLGGMAEFPQSGPSTTKELWKDVTDRFKLSDRGHIQQKEKSVWGYKRTPTPSSKDSPYPTVQFSGKQLLFRGGIEKYNGKNALLHILVWMSFGENDGVIPDDMTVDHLASDRTFDARLCNLRTATDPQQRANQIHKPREERNNSMKMAVWGKPKDAPEEAWEWFRGQREAADILNDREGKTQKFDSAAIGRAAKGRFAQHNGWVFKRAGE